MHMEQSLGKTIARLLKKKTKEILKGRSIIKYVL